MRINYEKSVTEEIQVKGKNGGTIHLHFSKTNKWCEIKFVPRGKLFVNVNYSLLHEFEHFDRLAPKYGQAWTEFFHTEICRSMGLLK